MKNFNFYGANLTIVPITGLTQLQTQELYSEWKEWVMSGTNSQWPQAFDVLGGDALSPGVNAGSYFFLRNDLGWKLKPAEENATVYVYGNLVPRDSSLPIMVPTTGQYTVLYAGLQPITQSVSSLLTTQEINSYNGRIYVDTFNGYSGDVYPFGTAAMPVNNLQSALALGERYGFSNYVLHGEIVVPSSGSYRNVNVFGDAAVARITFDKSHIGNSMFTNCQISGSLAEEIEQANFINCFIKNLDEINANMNQCVLDGTVCFTTGTHYLLYCSAGNYAAITCDNRSGVNFIFRNWAGPVEFTDSIYDTNKIMMDSFSSHVIFGPTFLKGDVTIYGVGQITNNSTGNFLLNTQLLKAPQINTIENKIDNVMAISL